MARPRPLTLVLGPRKPRRNLYFTKDAFLRVWSSTAGRLDGLAIFCQGGLPSRDQCELLRLHARWAGHPILFVGDLDPLDLTIFAALRNGNAELRRSLSSAVPIRYLGIDDRWLHLCRDHLRPTIKALDALTIRMDETEREHFQVVKRVIPELEQIIGPECFALLESDRKLELEGAGHPGLYRKGFGPALSELLLHGRGHHDGPARARGFPPGLVSG